MHIFITPHSNGSSDEDDDEFEMADFMLGSAMGIQPFQATVVAEEDIPHLPYLSSSYLHHDYMAYSSSESNSSIGSTAESMNMDDSPSPSPWLVAAYSSDEEEIITALNPTGVNTIELFNVHLPVQDAENTAAVLSEAEIDDVFDLNPPPAEIDVLEDTPNGLNRTIKVEEDEIDGTSEIVTSGSSSPVSITSRQLNVATAGDRDDPPISNPFMSDEVTSEFERIHGDGIGDTVYSERQVLQILMKWIQELQKHVVSTNSENPVVAENGQETENQDTKLDKNFKKDMILLKQMSAVRDVGNYLAQQDVFVIIKNTLTNSSNERLIGISLEILGNVLASLDDLSQSFCEIDKELKLIESVTECALKFPLNVNIQIEVFAVATSVLWNARKTGLDTTNWISIFTEPNFMSVFVYVLKSSKNLYLLHNAMSFTCTLFEVLFPESELDETERADTATESPSAFVSNPQRLILVNEELAVALCEALKEILQPSKLIPRTYTILEDILIPEPLQKALQKGLASLFYFQKVAEGRTAIRNQRTVVTAFLTDFFNLFDFLLENRSVTDYADYYIGGLTILRLCLDTFDVKAVLSALRLAKNLVTSEDVRRGVFLKWSDQHYYSMGIPAVIVNIGIATGEYLRDVEEKFGAQTVRLALHQQSDVEFIENPSTDWIIDFINFLSRLRYYVTSTPDSI